VPIAAIQNGLNLASVPIPPILHNQYSTATHFPEASTMVLEGVSTARQSVKCRRVIIMGTLLPSSDGYLVTRL
jgi:hypothetical protein